MLKSLLIFFLLILATVAVKAQNLVPNPSFEDTTSCPVFSDISYATGWENYRASPDYYNLCSASGSFGIPYNWVGQQNTYEGNGYAGIVAYASGSQREVIGIQLTQNLIIGTKYFVSGYISRADSADNSPFTCASNKFGFKFSTIPFLWSAGSYAPINNFSHVHSDSIITDKSNWTKITGSFIADSVYQYIMIGNFYDNLNTDTSDCDYSLALAYYYVDAICVSTDSMQCNVQTNVNNQTNLAEFSVYPNPLVNTINIDFSRLLKPYNINIYNSLGQSVFSKKEINTSHLSIDVTHLNSGFLFLTILHDNQSYNYKLLKQ
ncbi:MAG: hypothetical protein K0S44_889 [Bacteroidetes bacterium]|jgi:hypothetical protein|nr:hypothetical protein [Bacteroidota bacterium]